VVLVGVAVAAFFAAGLGNAGGTPRQQMQNWEEGTGFAGTVGTLRADVARISTVVAQHRGAGAVHADCGVLLVDAERANTELPTPDDVLTRLLSESYSELGRAANDCYDAGGSTGALQARSARERAAGRTLLARAVARLDRVLGTTVATTTTTSPGGGGIFG
jgi:hypothetical protein